MARPKRKSTRKSSRRASTSSRRPKLCRNSKGAFVKCSSKRRKSRR